MKKRVKFMITAFRDGFQSAYGARVFTRDFLPAVEAAVEAGLTHFEAGGGALTANTQMMRDNDTLDRFEDVIMQMGEVVARGGFGTSVTPVSQFYFQQAFNNVFFGPWKSIAEGYGKMVLGYFGRTPVEPGESVTEGDVLVVIELMNMETDIVAPLSGVIYSIPTLPGQSIRPGDPLVVIKS